MQGGVRVKGWGVGGRTEALLLLLPPPPAATAGAAGAAVMPQGGCAEYIEVLRHVTADRI